MFMLFTWWKALIHSFLPLPYLLACNLHVNFDQSNLKVSQMTVEENSHEK